MTKKKVCFILPSLKAGGAERVISFLAKNLDSKVFDVKIAVVGFKKDTVYDIDDLDVVFFNRKRLIYCVYPLFKFIKKNNPDLVFGSISHVNILLSCYNLIFRDVRFIIREASVMSSMLEFSKSKQQIPRFILKILYNKLDGIVCQSSDIKKDLINQFGIIESKLAIINNPITQNNHLSFSDKKSSNLINLITVGRLSAEKGHQRILKGLSEIKNYAFLYTIIGSGPLKYKIKSFADELGIIDKIKFIDHTSNVLDYVSKSDFFIQGSYVEGFPNAVLESCSVGTPVLAFNCPGGTREIIEDRINGFLAGSEKDFNKILQNLNKIQVFDRDIVRATVFQKFSSKKIIKEYESFLLSILLC